MKGATGTVEGLDHPAGPPPGDAFPCHILDTTHASNELIKTKNKMMPLFHIHIRLFPFMLYIAIGGSVAQFSYRLMLRGRRGPGVGQSSRVFTRGCTPSSYTIV